MVLGLFMLFPIYLAVVMSIKPVEELFIFPPKLYAIRPTLDNFRDMFEALHQNRVPFSRYVFNSFAVTVSVTVLQCIFASMAAFVLAKIWRMPSIGMAGRKMPASQMVTRSLNKAKSLVYSGQY